MIYAFEFLVEKELISEFLTDILPFLQSLILQGPELFPEAEEGKIKLLKTGIRIVPSKISLKKKNAFFF